MDDGCGQFDPLIARAGQLSTADAARLAAHLAGCEACRGLARLLEPVDGAIAFADTNASEPLAGADGAIDAAPRDRDLGEATADRYRITGEVGRGGIGRVLQARDRVLDRSVALKELFAAGDETRRRFLREALITARLQHPSIVPVYDAGHRDGRLAFYAMKLVAGRPLDEAIAKASTLARRLALLPNVLAIADAMAYAHSERIIHRDLKPSNVLIGRYGETVVIDWGLAKDLAVDDADAPETGPYRAAGLDQTAAGSMLGTPAYMAPEQAAGKPVDERADVYALGAILYHTICGRAPHEGTTLDEMVRHVVSGSVRPLTEREPEVPRDLAAIVNKAMALEPSGRYATAQGLANDLRRYLTGQLVVSHTYRTGELVRRWVKRHRAAVTVAIAALLVVAVGGLASVMRIVRAREQADEAAALAIVERSNAERERNAAAETLVEMLSEQGRAELLAGRPGRAAVYLSQALARSRDPGAALRTLLASAMRSIDGERLSLAGRTGELELAAFSRDGTRIVTAGAGRTANVWDAASGTVVATLSGHERNIKSASFSPDSSRIVTASRDETARLWDARTGKLLASFDHPDEVWSAAFDPGGGRALQRQQGVRGRIRRTRRELQQVGGSMGEKSSPMFGWGRCAAISAIVCSIAACSPPNSAWSSPEPAWQSAGPEESASRYEDEGNDVAEDDDAGNAPSAAANEDQAVSATERSYATPGKTCAAVCRRFSDCKLFSFEPCMEECGKQGAEGTAEGRRTNLVQARSSCSSLAAEMAPSDWVCIAEGESIYGYDVDSGTGDVQGNSTVHLAGQGKTRDDAQDKAISNCQSMMTVDLNRNGAMNLDPSPQGSWGSAVSSPCHITQCYAPARARGGQRSSR